MCRRLRIREGMDGVERVFANAVYRGGPGW